MQKLTYETPEMEITRFDAEDIIRTSPIPGNSDDNLTGSVNPFYFG